MEDLRQDWVLVPSKNPNFREFEEARAFVRSLNFKKIKEWFEYCKSGCKPEDIPYSPHTIYQYFGWEGYGNWIRADFMKKKDYLPFEEARAFIHSLKLKGQKAWIDYCKSGEKPKNIPKHPSYTYADLGWAGMNDWLGYTRIRPFEEARAFVHALKLKNEKPEWREYCQSGKKPKDIPYSPEREYKNKGWINMKDWLGMPEREFLSFEEAREFVHSLNIKRVKDWEKYAASDKRPRNIPFSPNQKYKEWVSWDDWLGRPAKEEFLSFEKSKEAIRPFKIQSIKEWQAFVASNQKPKNIVAAPHKKYKEWAGWRDWLGTLKEK